MFFLSCCHLTEKLFFILLSFDGKTFFFILLSFDGKTFFLSCRHLTEKLWCFLSCCHLTEKLWCFLSCCHLTEKLCFFFSWFVIFGPGLWEFGNSINLRVHRSESYHFDILFANYDGLDMFGSGRRVHSIDVGPIFCRPRNGHRRIITLTICGRAHVQVEWGNFKSNKDSFVKKIFKTK